jgi:nicotinate-nucleotide pyrophosphorylase (carboxylating)
VVVEVETEQQLEIALAAGATHLLVDNQSPEQLARWARRAGPGVIIQASGGITEANARAYAEAGAHLLAIGASHIRRRPLRSVATWLSNRWVLPLQE